MNSEVTCIAKDLSEVARKVLIASMSNRSMVYDKEVLEEIVEQVVEGLDFNGKELIAVLGGSYFRDIRVGDVVVLPAMPKVGRWHAMRIVVAYVSDKHVVVRGMLLLEVKRDEVAILKEDI